MAALRGPAGFTTSKFAEGLDMPRMLAVMPNGDLYVSNCVKGTITLVRDANHDGKAKIMRQVAQKPHLHGVSLQGNKLYISAIRQVYVAHVLPDGGLGELKELYHDLHLG